ncbi:HAD family hydrolase [Flavobacteriaceae bacterium]|nr:HAD family hydrolase [Flavobacteriaceae bacterium]
MKKNKLIIFDIDGTLIDSVSNYHEVIIKAMNALGISSIDSNFNALKHHTDSYALKYNYENFFNKELPLSLLNDFELKIVEYLKLDTKTIAIKGSAEVLNQLCMRGYAIAFATGSLQKSAIFKMNSAGLDMNIEVLATSKTSFSREGFILEAIDKAKSIYNVSHFDKIVSIGDGIWDLKTAQNLKLNFIGIGLKNKELMQENGMEIWFEDFSTFDFNIL